MNTMELEKLSENEMMQIKGGEGQWIFINGQWILIDGLDLGDEDYENM